MKDLEVGTFDRWNRRILPHPITGEIKPFTRMTTLVDVLQDQTGLQYWKARMQALGMGRREDLWAIASTITDADTKENKAQLDKIVEAAEEAAGGSEKANRGTAIHAMIARSFEDENYQPPTDYSDDIAACKAAMKKFGMWPL